MPQPPELTAERRQAGLQRSLELRRQRAELKQWLAGDVCNRPLFERTRVAFAKDYAQGMKVYNLVRALPGIGNARALSLLDAAGISVKTTVRACGPKQRERLFALLNK